MKLMKTQGTSDAMQMAHYKLTIIIIIRVAYVQQNSSFKTTNVEGSFLGRGRV